MVLAILSGAVVSTGVLFAISNPPHPATIAIAVVVGMILGHAVWTAARH